MRLISDYVYYRTEKEIEYHSEKSPQKFNIIL